MRMLVGIQSDIDSEMRVKVRKRETIYKAISS